MVAMNLAPALDPLASPARFVALLLVGGLGILALRWTLTAVGRLLRIAVGLGVLVAALSVVTGQQWVLDGGGRLLGWAGEAFLTDALPVLVSAVADLLSALIEATAGLLDAAVGDPAVPALGSSTAGAVEFAAVLFALYFVTGVALVWLPYESWKRSQLQGGFLAVGIVAAATGVLLTLLVADVLLVTGAGLRLGLVGGLVGQAAGVLAATLYVRPNFAEAPRLRIRRSGDSSKRSLFEDAD